MQCPALVGVMPSGQLMHSLFGTRANSTALALQGPLCWAGSAFPQAGCEADLPSLLAAGGATLGSPLGGVRVLLGLLCLAAPGSPALDLQGLAALRTLQLATHTARPCILLPASVRRVLVDARWAPGFGAACLGGADRLEVCCMPAGFGVFGVRVWVPRGHRPACILAGRGSWRVARGRLSQGREGGSSGGIMALLYPLV